MKFQSNAKILILVTESSHFQHLKPCFNYLKNILTKFFKIFQFLLPLSPLIPILQENASKGQIEVKMLRKCLKNTNSASECFDRLKVLSCDLVREIIMSITYINFSILSVE